MRVLELLLSAKYVSTLPLPSPWTIKLRFTWPERVILMRSLPLSTGSAGWPCDGVLTRGCATSCGAPGVAGP